MLRYLAWAAVACVALVLALALLRGGAPDPQRTVIPIPERTVALESAAPPAPAPQPETPPPPVAAVEPTDAELQVQEDAAAVGMTTREPEPGSEPAAETPPT